MTKSRNSECLRVVRLIPNSANLYYHSANFYYYNFGGKTVSTNFNKYRIRNFQPNDVILFSICVLKSFQFHLLSQADIKAIIKRNWKNSKNKFERI